ncbi:MAG: hypothetical protein COU40_01510 [Candidatus Moranbacteria bacterium CG10_big_fil_rev_8_21_14_0_10_35_21]|nr:MAG: hypothetical protein COU40_01510 [Candidatus Moranbacteria bacterium CG10_big_fil_rev_8_21_14_0_10_35_21]PJA88471.1 MAG: hypothetical protein CO139_02960 [Candidatus Moranbacteria bacterium CG_4_9_14_3_um_filter_36_9]
MNIKKQKMKKLKSYQKIVNLFILAVFLFAGVAIFSFSARAEGVVDCSEQYKFGSVSVDLNSEIESTVSGVSFPIAGKITNKNNFPIIDGLVYAKVYKKQVNEDFFFSNGDFAIDQFIVEDKINLDSNETKDLNFSWKVPSYATSGEYKLAVFYASSGSGYWAGLSFTDDVVGNYIDFSVVGEIENEIVFNKNNAKLNNRDFKFIAFPQIFSKDEDVTAKVELNNSTAIAEIVPVKWTLYYWDGLQEKNIIETREDKVQVPANGKQVLEYVVENNEYPVYYLTGEAQYKDTKSIINIRFVRSGMDRTRISSPLITNFPLKKGEANNLFSCVHSTGPLDKISDNKFEIVLEDEKGRTIHSYIYEGDITGAMMGLKSEFTPSRDYNKVTLKAELKNNGQTIDRAEIQYDCQKINPDLCTSNGFFGGLASEQKKKVFSYFSLALFISILIFVISVIAIMLAHRNKNSGGGFKTFILAIIISSGLLLGSSAKAAEWTNSKSLNKSFQAPLLDLGDFGPGVYSKAFSMDYLAISYSAKVKTGGISLKDDSNVSIGSKLNFSYNLGQIYWNGTGYSWGSPFGYWKNNAKKQNPNTCKNKYLVSYFNQGSSSTPNYGAFVQLSIDPHKVDISHSNKSDGEQYAKLDCNANGTSCIVKTAGKIKVAFDFAKTAGKLYYANQQYDYKKDKFTGSCREYPLKDSDINIEKDKYVFNFNAVEANNPPEDPIITGPVTGTTNTSYSFQIKSTDPDGDKVKFEIDWPPVASPPNKDQGTVLVNSGEEVTASKIFISTGAKTFKVRAVDDKGTPSKNWVSYTIDISALASCNIDTFTATPPSINFGNSVALSWSGTGISGNCAIYDGFGNFYTQASPLVTSPSVNTTYTANCYNNAGNACVATISVSVSCVETIWNPNTDTECVGKTLNQTNNCGTTKLVSGTKTCSNTTKNPIEVAP